MLTDSQLVRYLPKTYHFPIEIYLGFFQTPLTPNLGPGPSFRNAGPGSRDGLCSVVLRVFYASWCFAALDKPSITSKLDELELT